MIKQSVSVDKLIETARHCLKEGFVYPVLHTAVDYETHLELIYILRNLEQGDDRILSVILDANAPSVPSLTPWIPGLIFQEREVYDLFGVSYDHHPHLTRLLLPDKFRGHPLRKHYTLAEGEVTS
ncbi:MAG: NADH-quinone oxidoreductase subunit C [Sulfobacillus thermosulfidooxidans]|uniref:NADH:ubiquinone oxidoreductase 30kDa subunit domain-containing protein n=1 Tax=Sulfobacillus thermotolerans TaxID=338644 RepID=A0ABM6RP62_9FIRM|nr:NADH-quinone oxidoreductase subunit C [Sulfobacillus sp. hq2]AUW93138.1 hypothetical protein BXT84_03530 [Sulfobacillus thermotolerans]POB10061.1 NADH-quinone oxidoreductase subunit C [Sulfobacillus sp. hq2]PSR36738.1 MAG: NADH-quinone oxidoreductase subunit C [Sulfobacillus thermosulfidooxidans]